MAPKSPIGIKRRPNRRDLKVRNNLRGLPDPDPQAVLHRSNLELQQAVLRMQHTIIEANNESSLRDSLRVLADPEARWSDTEWETVADEEGSETDSEDERGWEDAFVAKTGGVEMEEVRRARGVADMQRFIKKVRAVKGKGPNGAARAAAPSAALANMQPGMTVGLTTAQAALALTNAQSGTDVTMADLRTVSEVEEDDRDTYNWTVGSVATRALTVAEAALILTNVQAGTDFSMKDLRTAREMVDLWDNEDKYVWTVGNLE